MAGIYSDFRHHDLGERFYEYHYVDGRLWMIRRHGGAAAEATDAYLGLPSEGRRAVLAFLRSLVLYQPDTLAPDIDGDDRIADMFRRGEHPLRPVPTSYRPPPLEPFVVPSPPYSVALPNVPSYLASAPRRPFGFPIRKMY